jgi:predicted acylesterase/phospholipase RssA
MKYDLVFEGGGAKGMVFVGALQELFKDNSHTTGRLLGTSAGAITAALLAAGYTPEEMLTALGEKDSRGKPIFESFLGDPAPFDSEAVRSSALRRLLGELNLPFVPDFVEEKVDDWIASRLAENTVGRRLFSFVERGGWYSADPFVAWLQRMMDTGQVNGTPRKFSALTLEEFYAATKSEMTLVAADTNGSCMLLLNHRTAPDCPVVWAVRMSMSIPFLWQEVEWQRGWGPYYAWSADAERLVENDITGHAIVDGGLLSNFPIALFLADSPDVRAVVGLTQTDNILGLLIDEAVPVPKPAAPGGSRGITVGEMRTVQRLRRLVNTATGAHDNMAIAVFAKHVVRLPAAGYGTTEFDMSDPQRDALVEAGRKAMRTFLAQQPVPERVRGIAPPRFSASDAVRSVANLAAGAILQR